MIYHFLSRIGVEKYLSSRYFSSWLILGIDALLSVFATFIAYLLVRGLFPNPVFTVEYGACLLAGSCLLSVISFVLFRTFRSIIRHSTLREIWKLGAAVLLKDAPLFGYVLTLPQNPAPSHGCHCHGPLIGCLGYSVPVAGTSPRHDRHPRSAQIEICPT